MEKIKKMQSHTLKNKKYFDKLLEDKKIIIEQEIKNIHNGVLDLKLGNVYRDDISNIELKEIAYEEILEHNKQLKSIPINYILEQRNIWSFRAKYGIMLKKHLKTNFALNEIIYIKEPFLKVEYLENNKKEIYFQYDKDENKEKKEDNKKNEKYISSRFLKEEDSRYYLIVKNITIKKFENFYLEKDSIVNGLNDIELCIEKDIDFNDLIVKKDVNEQNEGYDIPTKQKNGVYNKYVVYYECELINKIIQKNEEKKIQLREYFYRLKIPKLKSYGVFHNEWDYSTFDMGYILAKDKEDARSKISKEYNEKLSMRVKTKDIGEKDIYFINIYDSDDYYDRVWLEEKQCEICSNKFSKLKRDKTYLGKEDVGYLSNGVCSPECNEIYKYNLEEERKDSYINNKLEQNDGIHLPCIYKITNKKTNKSYIGQTTQAFTFRWYQHFCQKNGTTKFYQEINDTKLTDWMFEVIEIIERKDITEDLTLKEYISKREKYWIDFFDTISSGYNSLIPVK
jgi:hypothetical protein